MMCRCEDSATSSHGVATRLTASVGGWVELTCLKKENYPCRRRGSACACKHSHSSRKVTFLNNICHNGDVIATSDGEAGLMGGFTPENASNKKHFSSRE